MVVIPLRSVLSVSGWDVRLQATLSGVLSPRTRQRTRIMTKKTEGELVRNAEGQFVEGVSGNPKGRPKGSKNRITLLKMQTEEAFRERNQERLDIVLDLILQDALDGDKAARKMIFDAVISKANVQEDKSAGQKQTINVHRMQVVKGDTSKTNEEESSHE